MTVLISYDLDCEWGAVKAAAFDLGFYNLANTTRGERQLPNTTLFLDDGSPKELLALFDQAVANARRSSNKNIQVEKIICSDLSNWVIRVIKS